MLDHIGLDSGSHLMCLGRVGRLHTGQTQAHRCQIRHKDGSEPRNGGSYRVMILGEQFLRGINLLAHLRKGAAIAVVERDAAAAATDAL
jgi:hypothetical protein